MWIVYNIDSRNCYKMLGCTCTSERQSPIVVTGIREYSKSICEAGGYVLEYNGGAVSMGAEWFREGCPTCQHYTSDIDWSTTPYSTINREVK